jgi:hypothetical protein
VWHCHILGHEENDFMRPMVLNVATTVPTAPTTLTATLGTPTRADLTWADNATNEVGYFVQRRTGAAAFATIAELVPDVRTYSDLTVVENQQYDYQVIAFNQAGNSAPSNLAGVNGPTQVQVAGTITTVVGAAPLAGVTVTFSNGGGTTTTNASGAYTATLPYGWTGTVTPTLAGYLFTPAVRSYTNVIVNAFAQNFTAAVAVSISGQIYVNNSNPVVNIPGVTVTFSNGGYTAVSGANGIYTALVPSGYTGVATPTLASYTFAPATRTYTNVTTTQTGGNYRGTKIAVVSGTVTVNGNPLSGVTITFSNGGGTATTAANGTYTRTLNAGWSGTITPSRTGYVFNPTNATVANIQANQTNDFTVSAVAISGMVYFNSVPVSPRAGVTVTLSGVGFTTTNAQGNYTINVPVGYTGTLTYSGLGYIYTPATRTFTNITTPQVNMNSRTNL